MRGLALLTAFVLLVARPAAAQQLSLDIRDGLVTLHATNVAARQILAEWTRVGGTRVVGAERVAGPPLTLSLEGVPEGKALDIVLRGAAGYMAAARAVPGSGKSTYDRILVLATSTPPAGGGSAPAAASGRGATPRPFAVPQVSDQNEAVDVGADTPMPEPVPDPSVVNPFANAFGQPGVANPFGQPVTNPFGQPVANPFGQPIANPFGQPLPPQTAPAGGLFTPLPQQQPATTPGFFGAPGSTMPGVVQQPPQQPGAPGVRPRPQ